MKKVYGIKEGTGYKEQPLFYTFIPCALYFCTLLPCYSQIGGNNTYEFLNLVNPARVVALGGTLISVKDNDLNLSIQNPSLLDSTVHNSLSMSYVDYFTDIQYGYAVYSRTFKKIGSFSAGMQFMDYGSFTSAGVTGEITGQFTAAEYALNLSYARPIDSLFSIGGTVKTIYSALEEYSSIGNAIDFGATYNNKKHLVSAALVIKNFGRQWKTYYFVREPLPFEVQIGVSKKISHAPFRINFTATHLEKWDITYSDPSIADSDPITGEVIEDSKLSKFSDKLARHIVFGGEILLSKNFHLRVGYNFQRRKELKLETRSGIAGFSFGFGLRINRFHLSYGYARYHLAGGPNHFTISTNLSEFHSKKK
ncbi:MAG: type IX secretion system protein PorQ [Bacteroidetes bacterium]|nr:MAG: type IX secretion system protein PorQ [Bacteroidota bacterium]